MTKHDTNLHDSVQETYAPIFGDIEGEDTPEWQALLDRPTTFTVGKDAKTKVWKSKATSALRGWLNAEQTRGAVGYGLTRHIRSKKKEGSCIVFGELAAHDRVAKGVVAVDAIALDVDSGESIGDAIGRVKKAGWAAVFYTTYSDNGTESDVGRDVALRALDIERDPTDTELRTYLRDHYDKYLTPHIIESAKILDAKHHTSKGVRIVFSHAPLEKYRIVFFLAETLTITDLASTHKAALDVFADLTRGLAQIAGVHADPACIDPSRLFYLPRHPAGAEPYTCVVRGRGITADDIPRVADPNRAKRAKSGPILTPKGLDLRNFPRSKMLLGTFLDALAPDIVRGTNGDKVYAACPNEDRHSESNDTDCFAVDGDGDEQKGTWHCSHGGCKVDGTLERIAQAMEMGIIDEELFFLPHYEGGAMLCEDEDVIEEPPSDRLDGLDNLKADNGSTDGGGSESAPGDEAEADSASAGAFEPRDFWLPDEYKIKKNTIFKTSGKKRGNEEPKEVPVCQIFDLVGRSSNADGTAGAGRIISFRNENGKDVELTIMLADIMVDGNAVIRNLSDAGLFICGRGSNSNGQMLDLLKSITPKRQIPTVNVPGWVRDDHGEIVGFMHPTGAYDRVNNKTPPFRLLEGSRVEITKSKGTLEGWTAAAQEALTYADSNFYWPLGLVSGFAGPLLGILEWLPCGFSLSGLTSKGKTMAQIMGATVWASPAAGRGILFTANTTGNAMEDLAVRGTDTMLAMDEIGAMSDKKALGGMLFALSTARTKSRKASRERGLTQGDSFRPFTVLSSEKGMRNEIKAAGDSYRGGLAVRFPDIDVSDGVTVADIKLAKLDAFKSHYGHAGPRYIRHLIEDGVVTDPAKLEKEVLTIAADLTAGCGAAMARAARVFAVVQRGGELAAEAGLLGDVDKAKVAINLTVATAWDTFNTSDEAGAATGGDSLLDSLRSFLFGELNRRIVVVGVSGGRDDTASVADDHAYARGDVLGWADADVIYLDSSKVQDPSTLGLDIGSRNEMTKQLLKMGVLIAPDGKGATFRQLPKELAISGDGGAAVRNIRLCRTALGI